MKTLICITSFLLFTSYQVHAQDSLSDHLKLPTLTIKKQPQPHRPQTGVTLIYKDSKLSKIYYPRRKGYSTTTGYDYETNESIMIVHPRD